VKDLVGAVRRGGIDGARFGELVTSASDEELTALMNDLEGRTLVLAAIFEQMGARLRPDRARGIRETIHWHVEGGPGGAVDSYQVRIEDGIATVGTDLDGDPRVAFEVDPVAFLRMTAGQVNGMKLILARKLKVRGDMIFAPRVEGLFDTDPTSPGGSASRIMSESGTRE
jgi:putative sterol carrier protein